MGDKVRACTYCSLTYGSKVYFKDGRMKVIQEVEDHFWPKSLGETREDNIVSCCNMCNGIKTDKTFETVQEVRSFLSRIYDEIIERTVLRSPSLVRDMKEILREAKKQIDSVRTLQPVQVDVPAEREVLLNSMPSTSLSKEESYKACSLGTSHAYTLQSDGLYHCLDCSRTVWDPFSLRPVWIGSEVQSTTMMTDKFTV